MAQSLVVEHSLVIPVGIEEAFEGTLPAPIPAIFANWHGPLPPVKQVFGQDGEWGAVGQTRTLKMAGGGSVREELISVEPPKSFGYRLTDIKGPLARLISTVEGAFVFRPVDEATEVTWRWTIQPKSALSAHALPMFALLWEGYARKALRELSGLLAV